MNNSIRAFHIPTQTWAYASVISETAKTFAPDSDKDPAEFACYSVIARPAKDGVFFPQEKMIGWTGVAA